MSIAHGTSIEREIGLAKKQWKELKASGADASAIATAKENYNSLKTKGTALQAEKKSATKKDTTKYEKEATEESTASTALAASAPSTTTAPPGARPTWGGYYGDGCRTTTTK